MIKAYFGNIRELIIEKLKLASFDVYIAVAWITDKMYQNIFEELLRNNVTVHIIIVDDEINRNSNINWQGLVDLGANIYWDNHHHKFCVIDRKLVLTGSFNWTYLAKNRENRENVILIENEQSLIEEFSNEFYVLKKEAIKQGNSPKIVLSETIVEVEITKEIFVDKIVEIEVTKEVIVEKIVSSLGTFKGTFVLCGMCGVKLLKDNHCPNCNRRYVYNSKTNQYVSLI